jgi:hydrogenase maturation protease
VTAVRVIALGNPHAGDDGAALRAVVELDDHAEVVRAGRPGPGLLELLSGNGAVVLVDVIRSGAAPGTVVSCPLDDLVDSAVATSSVSSHGFGPAEALRLGRALGRGLVPGCFVGIEGACFEPGAGLSASVRAAMPELVRAVRAALAHTRGRS